MTRKLIVLIFLFFTFNVSRGQILNDAEGLKYVRESIRHIYNFEFDQAETYASRIHSKYPDHPVTYLLRAFQMYWKHLPIQEDKARIPEYTRLLNQCLEAVRKHYGPNSTDPEAVFFTMASRGYLAIMYNYQNEFIKAVGEARSAYKALIDGMKLTNVNPDFLFPSGMYNYYVIAYPETTPIVKPLMVFFKNGDKAKGLQQLDAATRKGVITMVESCFYLAHIYMEHESRPDKAHVYTSRLRNLYPNNPVFRMRYIETLLFNARYEEAETEMAVLKKYTRSFYPSAYHFFRGMVLEHDNHYAEAAKAYRQALAIPLDLQYTREYHAMAYAGLARIADRSGNSREARALYKKCLEHAEYKFVIREAKSYK